MGDPFAADENPSAGKLDGAATKTTVGTMKTTNDIQLMRIMKSLFAPALVMAVMALPAPVRAASLYPVLIGGRWGYADNKGAMVINPQFDEAQKFSGGLAAVKEGHWGYVATSGKLAVNPQFDGAGDFSGGLAAVNVGGHFGYVNTSGKGRHQPAV